MSREPLLKIKNKKKKNNLLQKPQNQTPREQQRLKTWLDANVQRLAAVPVQDDHPAAYASRAKPEALQNYE